MINQKDLPKSLVLPNNYHYFITNFLKDNKRYPMSEEMKTCDSIKLITS